MKTTDIQVDNFLTKHKNNTKDLKFFHNKKYLKCTQHKDSKINCKAITWQQRKEQAYWNINNYLNGKL